MKPYYRIARTRSGNYFQVERWRWWFPFWVAQCSAANYHDTVEEAEAYAKDGCRGPVVKYLGQL
jgi:hypothetical protein